MLAQELFIHKVDDEKYELAFVVYIPSPLNTLKIRNYRYAPIVQRAIASMEIRLTKSSTTSTILRNENFARGEGWGAKFCGQSEQSHFGNR
jgi:hypothetical protein